MNISVRRNTGGGSEKNLPMILSSIIDNSQESFEVVEVEGQESIEEPSIKKKVSLANLSQVLSSMSNINISSRQCPIIVETSIISCGVGIKEEVNPLEPEDIKLAFKGTWNLFIGILLLFILIITGSMLGPVTMYIKPAKHPLFKALWRAQSNAIYSVIITIILYGWNKMECLTELKLVNMTILRAT